MTPIARLHGARIRRIDAPRDDLYALTLAAPGYKGVLIVSLSPNASGVGLVAVRPQGRPASGEVMRLRKQLHGSRVVAIDAIGERGLELRVSRADGPRRLVIDLAARPALLRVLELEADGDRAEPRREQPAAAQLSLEALEERGRTLLARLQVDMLGATRSALRKSLTAARKRSERKLQDIAQDAERATQAPALRAQASAVLANLHAIPRGAATVSLVDYTQDPPRPLEISLDPARSAREQAELWFRQARRYERGKELATVRLASVERERQAVLALLQDVELASDLATLEALGASARKLGASRPSDASSSAATSRARPRARTPYRTFTGHAERRILVGRGASDNDALTLHHARPHDLWLHARDTAGAHVIVPLERNQACPPELLVDAALLAAHFSSERDQSSVDVTYAQRRHITKPKGAPPGSVQVQREKVLHLRVDATRLQHLLATETR